MRIAFIGQKGIPIISGGVERRVEELSVRMAKKGHDVFVYSRNNYNSQNIKIYKGVNLIYMPFIPTKNLSTISHTFLAVMHAIFQDYDVIHFQAPGPSSLCWLIRIFKPQAALVATFNSRDSQHQKWGLFARIYLLIGEFVISKCPDRTIAVTDILRRYIKKNYDVEAEVIHNGSSVMEEADSSLIKKWDLEQGKYFISVSRLIRHKGIHFLIDAFKEARREKMIDPDFKLVIVGEGAFTDDYVKELREAAQEDKNIIMTGNQKGGDLAALFKNAFCFVQPSYAEGLSNSLLEAMGYGLCPIISDIEENVSPVASNGIVFQKQNKDDLKEKIIFAFENKPLVRELGSKARANTEANYSWDNNVDRTLEIYEKILKSGKKNSFAKKLKFWSDR